MGLKSIYRSPLVIILVIVLAAVVGWQAWNGVTAKALRTDGEVLRVAGLALVDGVSPYDQSTWQHYWVEGYGHESRPGQIFAYPPTFLPFVYPLGLVPDNWVRHTLDIVNVASFILTALMLADVLRVVLSTRGVPSASLIAAGLILATSPAAMASAITTGQTSLLALCGLTGLLWTFVTQRATVWLVAFTILAMIKPQLTILPTFSLLLLFGRQQHWIIIAGSCALFSALTAAIFGTEQFGHFVQMLGTYQNAQQNSPLRLSGIPHLAARFGLSVSAFPALFVAIALWTGVWLVRRSRLQPLSLETRCALVALACTANAALVPMHSYDFVLLAIPLAFLPLIDMAWAVVLALFLLIAGRPNVTSALPMLGHSSQLMVVTLSLMAATMLGCLYAIKQGKSAPLEPRS